MMTRFRTRRLAVDSVRFRSACRRCAYIQELFVDPTRKTLIFQAEVLMVGGGGGGGANSEAFLVSVLAGGGGGGGGVVSGLVDFDWDQDTASGSEPWVYLSEIGAGGAGSDGHQVSAPYGGSPGSGTILYTYDTNLACYVGAGAGGGNSSRIGVSGVTYGGSSGGGAGGGTGSRPGGLPGLNQYKFDYNYFDNYYANAGAANLSDGLGTFTIPGGGGGAGSGGSQGTASPIKGGDGGTSQTDFPGFPLGAGGGGGAPAGGNPGSGREAGGDGGAIDNVGKNARANLGGGGGGSGYNSFFITALDGGNGGSGLIVIRYPGAPIAPSSLDKLDSPIPAGAAGISYRSGGYTYHVFNSSNHYFDLRKLL
jgi:hypothetical protein